MQVKNYKYKLHIAPRATYYSFITGREEELRHSYWTTIILEVEYDDNEKPNEPSDSCIKNYGKANLMKQIATAEWGTIKCWTKLVLDNSDIEIVRC